MMQTHTCGELTTADIDKEVTLCGWVASRRDHGKLIFIDIRDRYGLTQVVFVPKASGNAMQKAQELRSEFVIRLIGKVNSRPQGTINTKLPTGEIEVLATALEILNPSLTPPFEIQEELEIAEELRLKYRYLDLRRRRVFRNLIMRNALYTTIRTVLEAHDFLECETPILTKSTPEGA
ncbi:MAG: aspartate--tRNA ligase, partial [Candidatus Omnitrophica bacterium]|nr:aspartate--tRNA ligase [Candidatus Omnitrophota bacterium]